jgi:putative Ca2+/H+ antiporter (TMEM165/GDT1 family)
MWELIATAASAFGLVFLAEVGDKTQLLAMGFGARYPMRTVMIGLALGFAAAGAVAAVVGGVLGAALPEKPIAIVGGILFLVFAVMTLRGVGRSGETVDDDMERVVHTRNVVLSIALTIALGELGDKTQLTTIGAYFGSRLGARLKPDVVKVASAALFAVFGVLLLVSA